MMKLLRKVKEPELLDDPALAERVKAIASRSKLETAFYEISQEDRSPHD